MVERIEDLNLPAAVVTRIIRESLPDGASLEKHAKICIARAASVFVIYLTSTSTTMAQKQNHKNISPNNILDALKSLEFESFIPQLTQDLEAYRKMMKDKKESKAKKDGDAQASSTSSAKASDDK